MKYEYLIFNLVVFLPVFFLKSIFFKSLSKQNKKLTRAISFTAIFFLIKDFFSTNFLWYFNEKYIIGLRVLNLPVEEILFFITVPYSTLFVYQLINLKIKEKPFKLIKMIFFVLSIFLLIFSLWFLENKWYYTAYISAFVSFTYFLIFRKIGRRYFVFIIFIFFLTLIFNYYLTARPVVIYNPEFQSGLKIFTIPIEDFLYSFSLFNLLLFFLLEIFNITNISFNIKFFLDGFLTYKTNQTIDWSFKKRSIMDTAD